MKDKIIDASVLLALITAGMYFWGCLYYEGFYSTFGIPFYNIDIPTHALLLFSYGQVFVAIIAFIVISITAFAISKIPDDRREMRKGTRWLGYIGQCLKEAFTKNGIGLPLLFILLLYLLGAMLASAQGTKEANLKLNSHALQQNTVTYSGKKLENVGFLVSSDDFLYFFQKATTKNSFPKIYQIPKDKIEFIEMH